MMERVYLGWKDDAFIDGALTIVIGGTSCKRDIQSWFGWTDNLSGRYSLMGGRKMYSSTAAELGCCLDLMLSIERTNTWRSA